MQTHSLGRKRPRGDVLTQRELARNLDALESLQFPTFNRVNVPRPDLLTTALANGLRLEARIVDFWRGSEQKRNQLAEWLMALGFALQSRDTSESPTHNQIGASCSYVAAAACNLMYEAGENCMQVDVGESVSRHWIEAGNARLGYQSIKYLDPAEIYTLADAFRRERHPNVQHGAGWCCTSWLLNISSIDFITRQIGETLHGYIAAGSNGAASRAFYVSNTDDCTQTGAHWMSIAISMSWS